MDAAIKKHFQQGIREKTQLTGGYTFMSWLLTLESGKKVVFRTRSDFTTSGGRKIIVSDIFKREAFFYDFVNKAIGRTCPEVYVVDGTCEHYDKPFQISEYLEGQRLDLCFDSLDAQEKSEIYYKYGELAAKINQIEIDEEHPYVTSRGPWEEYLAKRLCERLVPLIANGVITQSEIDAISDMMRNSKAAKTLSFLHIDIRFINMIYSNGQIYLIDAENCEFGDPLFELAVIDISDNLTEDFWRGYESISQKPDISSDLFYLYKMERQALVLDVFTNLVKNEAELTQKYLSVFKQIKHRLLYGG